MDINELKEKLNKRIEKIDAEINSTWNQAIVERLKGERYILRKIIDEEY